VKIVASGYVGKKKTGIGRALENILRNMPLTTDDRVDLYCNHDFDDFKSSQFPPQVVMQRSGVSKNSSILNLLWHQISYPFKALLRKADVSYIPNVTFLALKFRPTVVVIHDLIEFNVPEKFSWYRMMYRKFAVPATARRADRIITVSEASKKDIVKYCGVPAEKIHVVYNGVDKKFCPMEDAQVQTVREKYKLPPQYILYVGTIDHPGKNVYSLIRACQKLWQAASTNVKLVLVGQEGHGFEHLKPMIASDDRIIHLGFVQDEDLPAIYCGARAFCFLSLYEGFGLPIVEAMACGVPVIVSGCPPFPEIVEQAGMIVDPMDIDQIGQKIQEVLVNEELREQMRNKGMQQARKFSWKAAGERTYEILQAARTGR